MMKKSHALPFRILRAIGIVLLAIVVLIGAFFGLLCATEYRPDDRETLGIIGASSNVLAPGAAFTVASWNIGYGALDKNADFFMDGGKMVRTASREGVDRNMYGIIAQIDAMQPDVLFLQEVDVRSSRSCRVNEYDRVADHLNAHCSAFANNFKVLFLPYPMPPIGKVNSGVATFSAFETSSAERIQLPNPFSWPVRMVNLKRCLLETRIPVSGTDRELVLFNLHLEAYDEGEGKRAQTEMLAQLLAEEREKGNYVIAGGDFNQTFSSADDSAFPVREGSNWEANAIDTTAFRGNWQFLMDEKTPSCRSLYKPYAGADKTTFQYYMIDGFIVSDNLEVKLFSAMDLGFTVSDHNPLLMRVALQ